jgi:hypothetical protein
LDKQHVSSCFTTKTNANYTIGVAYNGVGGGHFSLKIIVNHHHFPSIATFHSMATIQKIGLPFNMFFHFFILDFIIPFVAPR